MPDYPAFPIHVDEAKPFCGFNARNLPNAVIKANGICYLSFGLQTLSSQPEDSEGYQTKMDLSDIPKFKSAACPPSAPALMSFPSNLSKRRREFPNSSVFLRACGRPFCTTILNDVAGQAYIYFFAVEALRRTLPRSSVAVQHGGPGNPALRPPRCSAQGSKGDAEKRYPR